MTVQGNDILIILGILVLAIKKIFYPLRLVHIKAVMLQHLLSMDETQSEASIDVRMRNSLTLAYLFSMQLISPQLELLNITVDL